MRRVLSSLVTLLAFAASAAAQVRLTGTVRTEYPIDAVQIRVFALGAQVVGRPEAATNALVDRLVKAAEPFTIDVADVAPPLRVEAIAVGHVAAAFTVLVPEQAALPPLWLPVGHPLEVRAQSGGAGAVTLSGSCDDYRPAGLEFGHWRAMVPATRVDSHGVAKIQVPGVGPLNLQARTADGRWGVRSFTLPVKGGASVTVDSRSVRVAVRDRKGEPVSGIAVAVVGADHAGAKMTDAAGSATVQAPARGDVQVVALGRGLAGRLVRAALPPEPLALVVEPVRELEVSWIGSNGPIAFTPDWLPAPLTGGAALLGHSGRIRIPALAGGLSLTAAGPGVAAQLIPVSGEESSVALRFRAAVQVRGAVLGDEDLGMPGVPVWVADALPVSGERRLSGMRRSRPGARSTLPRAVTDGAGSFRVADLQPGSIRITARAPGFPVAEAEPVEEAPAGSTQEVEIRLVRGTWASVRVQGENARPLAGVVVRAFRVRERLRAFLPAAMIPPVTGEVPLAEGTTDQEGRLRLTGIVPGLVTLELTLAGYVPGRLDAEIPQEGKDLGVKSLDPGVTVNGRILDDTGRGVPDAMIVATGLSGLSFGGSSTTRSDPGGGFAVTDQPGLGDLFLYASAPGLVLAQPLKVAMPPSGPVELRMERGRTVEGRVTAARLASGVAGARIVLKQTTNRAIGTTMSFSSTGPRRHTETDGSGAFRLDAVAPGEYQLSVTANGFRTTDQGLSVPAEDALRPVSVVLKPGLEVRGRVVDSSGNPAPAVEVSARPATSPATGPMLSSVDTNTRTGPDGTFVLTGLDSGQMVILARDDDGAEARDMVEAGRPEEVVLRLETPGRLTGRVLTPDGSPVAGARVWASVVGDDSVGAIDTRSDASGSFSSEGLPPRPHRVTARADGWAPATEQVTIGSGTTTEVTLTLKRAGSIEGRVLGLMPEELKNCRVSAGGATAEPDSEGGFLLGGIAPGTVSVSALVIPPGRVRGVRTEVKEGVPARVEIDFSGSVTVTGTVRRAGRPVPGLVVGAASAGQGGASIDTTDATGFFTLKGLSPGELVVSARDDTGATLITRKVKADADTRVDLEIPAGTVQGRVTDAARREPLAGATVTLRSLDTAGLQNSATTDQAGAFHFEDLPNGAFTARAAASGFSPAESECRVASGRAPEVTLALQPEVRLTLVVRQSDGTVPGEIWLVPMRDGRVDPPLHSRCDREGKAVLTELPVGGWTLLVTAQRGAALVTAAVPGPDVAVSLVPSGSLLITAPPPSQGTFRARIVSPGGLVIPFDLWNNPGRGEWAEVPVRGLRGPLPVGPWIVQVARPDGTTRDLPAEVRPAETTTVQIE